VSESASNNTSRTNWEGVDSLSDEDIDTSESPPVGEEFFRRAKWRQPKPATTTRGKLSPMTPRYNPREIEPKWQQRWEADSLYEAEADPSLEKYYALVMFPYTSGDVHIGHWYNFAPADAHARFKRMHGLNVLMPMGFDAFGLPAENAAIREGIHPYRWTLDNIARMERQIRSIGGVYDWSKELATCLPEYYRWNQWFFLKLLEQGLAYRAKAPVNWCPKDQTVLANEQVVDGACERCHTPVVRRDLEQWFFKITAYADELLDFSEIEWPERVETMQRNWIGRSEGVEFDIPVDGRPDLKIPVYTTRHDTIFGMTFVTLAPEHSLVAELTTPDRKAEVFRYQEQAQRQSEIERLSTEREKTGLFIGSYALNPANGERVPIYISDYVLLSYGTGAIQGVPAHDERDFIFARKNHLPIPVVVAPPNWDGGELPEPYVEPGTMVNSGQFDGLPSYPNGKEAIADWLVQRGLGRRTVNYRLRDWLISRQRYWGTPIPIVYCASCGTVPVDESDLPVMLPEDAEFRPTGESPLKLHEGFVNAPCPRCSGAGRRETDTMDTFVDSSWYFLRFVSPGFDQPPGFDTEKALYWMPVDQYMGGVEHAVMHLMYARFFTRVLRDMGLVKVSEPFKRLYNQGIILGPDGLRMSKNRGNVVNPDEYVRNMGADTVRCFLMFIGPWDSGGPWSPEGINGVERFLKRVWGLVGDPRHVQSADEAADSDLLRLMHQTIGAVTEDYEKFRFNTMLAKLMEFSNELLRLRERASEAIWSQAVESLLLMLAPAAPHIAEELWTERLGKPYSIHQQSWPAWDARLAVNEEITLPVTVNGKPRGELRIPATMRDDQAGVEALALDLPRVKAMLDGATLRKVIYVPGRVVNLVVG
jgi:leucyl-tRNA synthetase